MIARALQDVDDEANVRVLAEGLSGSVPSDDFEVFARRLSGRLARKGYSDAQVRSAVIDAWAGIKSAPSGGKILSGL